MYPCQGTLLATPVRRSVSKTTFLFFTKESMKLNLNFQLGWGWGRGGLKPEKPVCGEGGGGVQKQGILNSGSRV